MAYGWPLVVVVVEFVVELVVEPPFPGAPGCVTVVWCVVVTDHGCHTKSPMKTATTSTAMIPKEAAPLPLSSRTITGSLMTSVFPSKRRRQSASEGCGGYLVTCSFLYGSKLVVEPAQTFGHDGHDLDREVRIPREQKEKALAIDDRDLDVGLGDHVSAALLPIDQRHLAEDASGVHGLKDLAAQADLDIAAQDDIHFLAAFAGGKEAMPRREPLCVGVVGKNRKIGH